MEREEKHRRARRITSVSLLANFLLMCGKIAAGSAGGSPAVVADGIESASDLLTVGVSMAALRVARRPLDSDHPYGHGRAEHLAALLVSLLIIRFGIAIAWDSAGRLLNGDFPEPGPIAAVAAAVTVVAKGCLWITSRKGAEELGSPAIGAIAADNRKDALVSLATLAGVGAAMAGFGWGDPLAALLSSGLVFRIGFPMFGSAVRDIMDASPEPEVLTAMSAASAEVPGVERIAEIRARRSGQHLIVDLKLDMDPDMTVKDSHAIGELVKSRLFELFPQVGDVMIHVNPHREKHVDLVRL